MATQTKDDFVKYNLFIYSQANRAITNYL